MESALQSSAGGITSYPLRHGGGSLRIALIIGEGSPPGRELYSYVVGLASKHRVRDVVIHVVSTYGRPHYMRALRDFIQSNISMSLTISYCGSTSEDLTSLLKSLREEGNLFKICVLGKVPQEFLKVLDDFEVGYDCLG